MSKAPSSVIGVDLGRYTVKSVLLQRRGSDRITLSNYAVREMGEGVESADEIAQHLKLLFRDMGGRAKACSVAISSSDSILRIIEQPQTPVEMLRGGLRLNSKMVLNQDCRDYVLDCDAISVGASAPAAPATAGEPNRVRYLVGGLPRTRIATLDQAFQKNRTTLNSVQLAPVCAFNAFEFSNSDIFGNEAFFLVDIGHSASTVTIGSKRELILVRSLEFGGKTLLENIGTSSGSERDEILRALATADENVVEHLRIALATLIREISSSIGFFEGRCEETIRRVFVSGGPARSQMLLKVMTEELHMECTSWNPFSGCEVSLPAHLKRNLEIDAVNLNVACGAAAELMKAGV
jgi:Tfp pilus assembly PilM family ATPase